MERRPPNYPPPVTEFRREMAAETRAAGRPLQRTRIAFDGPVGLIIIVLAIAAIPMMNLDILRHSPPWHIEYIPLVSLNILLLAVVAMLIVTRRSHRRIRRFLDGKCPDCGCDLHKDLEKCPKCGKSLA